MIATTYRDNGIWQVKIPLPFPLQWVNAYVVKGNDGYDVIDPGLRTPDAERQWEETSPDIGFRWNEVRSIVLTHHHPDHYGMAGWLQARTGAPVLLTETALNQAETLWGAEFERTSEDTLALFAAHGFPESEHPAMREHFASFLPLVSPRPLDLQLIEYGETIMLGNDPCEALHTPGHAAGHVSFFHHESGRMFCGDHVLPGITPNVSLLPFGDPDPLNTFLLSLQAAEGYKVSVAFPGHREPFSHYTDRISAIRAHHEDRLLKMESLLETPSSAYDVCRKLFGNRLSTHQLRFALSETLAHLVYLERRGRIRSRKDEWIQFENV